MKLQKSTVAIIAVASTVAIAIFSVFAVVVLPPFVKQPIDILTNKPMLLAKSVSIISSNKKFRFSCDLEGNIIVENVAERTFIASGKIDTREFSEIEAVWIDENRIKLTEKLRYKFMQDAYIFIYDEKLKLIEQF